MNTDCKSINGLFGTTNNEKITFSDTQKQEFYKYAKLDKPMVMKKIGGGYYQCFCKKFTSWSADSKELCAQMTKDKLIGRALTMGVTVSVNIVNSILKILVRTLVDMIGYDTDSERVSMIMVVTFISALVNTAIIPLFTNSNIRDGIHLCSHLPGHQSPNGSVIPPHILVTPLQPFQ